MNVLDFLQDGDICYQLVVTFMISLLSRQIHLHEVRLNGTMQIWKKARACSISDEAGGC